jgi:hypothetical protein
MRPVWLARVLTAVALTVEPSAQATSSVAQAPSLTITTRTTIDGVSLTTTEIVRTRGSRRRVDRIDERSDGLPIAAPQTTLYQCDLRRTVMLFAEHRTFAADPVLDDTATMPRPAPSTSNRASAGPLVTVTIETKDTGARRAIGRLTARRVVTTRTTEPAPDAVTPADVEVTDGWYVDVPRSCGAARGHGVLLALWGAPGKPFDQPYLIERGAPELGYAIEKATRTDRDPTHTTRTQLVSVSDAPLDDAIFEVPRGYRPALPLPGGGADPARVDSLANRVAAHLEWMASLIARLFS